MVVMVWPLQRGTCGYTNSRGGANIWRNSSTLLLATRVACSFRLAANIHLLDAGGFLRAAAVPERARPVHRLAGTDEELSDPSAAMNWGAIFAMSVLSLVLVFVIFVIFQKYLVQGISTTGLK
ncbi:MAG TPA: hypothetical protein VFT66_13600 [Roseiflexaceae bacterium]|nr:hypothetical protein [Roseiflexaceae bacterium]